MGKKLTFSAFENIRVAKLDAFDAFETSKKKKGNLKASLNDYAIEKSKTDLENNKTDALPHSIEESKKNNLKTDHKNEDNRKKSKSYITNSEGSQSNKNSNNTFGRLNENKSIIEQNKSQDVTSENHSIINNKENNIKTFSPISPKTIVRNDIQTEDISPKTIVHNDIPNRTIVQNDTQAQTNINDKQDDNNNIISNIGDSARLSIAPDDTDLTNINTNSKATIKTNPISSETIVRDDTHIDNISYMTIVQHATPHETIVQNDTRKTFANVSSTDKRKINYDIPFDDNSVYSIKIKSKKFVALYDGFIDSFKTIDSINDKKIYFRLYRLSYGFHKNETISPVGLNALSKYSGLCKNAVRNSLKSLEEKGYINKIGYNNSKGHLYRVYFKNLSGKPYLYNFEKDPIIIDASIFDILPLNIDCISVFIYLYLYLNSWCFGKNISVRRIGYNKIVNDLGISRSSAKRYRDILIENNLIRTIQNENRDGSYYRIFLPHEIIKIEKEIMPVVTYRKARAQYTDDSVSSQTIVQNDIVSNVKNSASYETIVQNDTTTSKSLNDGVNIRRISSETTFQNEPLKVKNNKLSSGDADAFFNFLKTELPSKTFPVSKDKINSFISEFGFDVCKKHIQRLKPRLTIAENAPGLWIDSLKNPANYPELDQKSENETLQELREKEAEQRRAAQNEERKKQEVIQRVNTAWNSLTEMQQEEFIAQSEKYFRDDMGMGNQLPPRAAIVERAKKIASELSF